MQKAVFNFITKIILMLIVSYLGKTFFPEIHEVIFFSNFWSIYTTLVIIMCFIDYQKSKDASDHYSFIRELRKEDLSYAKLEKYALRSETFAEISKTKLDILKSLSPIPLIVFLLGFYTSNNANINKKISIFSTNLLLGELLMYVGVGIVVFYVYLICSSFASYKKHIRRAVDYRSESIIAKSEKENSLEQSNEAKDFA